MAVDMLNPDGTPKEQKKDRVLVPAGPQVARFCQYVEIGVQKRPAFNGTPKKPANSAVIAFEFPTHMHDFGEAGNLPLMISRTIPLFADPKSNAFKYFMAIRQGVGVGQATNFMQMVGTPLVIKVTHRSTPEGEFANVLSDNIQSTEKVNPMAGPDDPKEYYDVPELKGSYASFEWDKPTLEAYDALPEWIQKKIVGAENFSGSPIANLLQGRENQKLGIPTGQEQAPAAPEVPQTPDAPPAAPVATDDVPL